jgi:hypothetical protein
VRREVLIAQELGVDAVVNEATGCVVYIGPRSGRLCVSVWTGGRSQHAHRVVYARACGPIPHGRIVRRTCATPGCVSLAHLQLASVREVALAGRGVGGMNARKTHCPHGHAYDEENTRRHRGRRFCRACHRDRTRASSLRKSAA